MSTRNVPARIAMIAIVVGVGKRSAGADGHQAAQEQIHAAAGRRARARGRG